MRQYLTSDTIFSLGGERPYPPTTDPSAGTGETAAFDCGTLSAENVSRTCDVRWLSAAGAVLRLADAVAEEAAAVLDLANGLRLPGHIAWSHGGEAGLVFDTPIDVVAMLARNLANLPAERRRLPRIELRQTVGIVSGDRAVLVSTRNISQGGVGVEGRFSLAEGDAVQLIFDGLRPMAGHVRWVRDASAGIAFAEELGWQTLLPWLRELQSLAGSSAPAEGELLIPDKGAIRLDAAARVREGVRWWNVRVRALTQYLVEFEARHAFASGAQLWIALPGIGGGPARVVETGQNRALCEFRLPLRPDDLRSVTGGNRAG